MKKYLKISLICFLIGILGIFFLYKANSEEDILTKLINDKKLTTPKRISNWIFYNISYKKSIWKRQTPLETYNLKTGDCIDLALLNQELLGRIGIASTVICLKWEHKKYGHALCIYKWRDRLWVADNFIHWKFSEKWTIEKIAKYYGGKIYERIINVPKGSVMVE